MRLAKAMSLAHMRFGENPDPATPAEKVWVCGGLSRYVEMATKLHIEEPVARIHRRVLYEAFVVIFEQR